MTPPSEAIRLRASTTRPLAYLIERPAQPGGALAVCRADIHGKSRAQVLESGGRVDKGITSEARSLDGTDDSGRKAHRARSATGADCGGLKLSSGKASNPGCRGYSPQYPRQGEMTYG